MKKYYLHNGEDQEGPFDIEDLKAKNIKSSTPIWFEGIPEWTTAGTVAELIPFFSTITPPPFQKSHSQPLPKTEPLKVSTETSKKRKSKIGWIIGLFLIGIVTVLVVMLNNNPNGLPDIKVEVNPPKPVVLVTSSEDASAVFKARIKIMGTIQNQGGNGNVQVTFIVTQNGEEFKKYQSILMNAGETKEVDQMFNEIKRGKGDIVYDIKAKSE